MQAIDGAGKIIMIGKVEEKDKKYVFMWDSQNVLGIEIGCYQC